MLTRMEEVRAQVAERDELIEIIAIALLTRKNVFILGDTGQAKSAVINLFRAGITGTNQFERLMSKQTDEEALFGRLDLSSLIPGGVPEEVLEKDQHYQELRRKLETELQTGGPNSASQLADLTAEMEQYRKALAELHSGEPRIITKGKLPDSHIVFLDEIFKASDGILNALLTALNERRYTNEGKTIHIPTISFFSASNEIPNFANPEEKILKPLYDRFELKVVTEYVEDRDARLTILKQKQAAQGTAQNPSAVISLAELQAMQDEVLQVRVPDQVNELMDDVLCGLRGKGIHISDRKYFNYAPIAQAKAWLSGRDTVEPSDLTTLCAYLWTAPEERTIINPPWSGCATIPSRTGWTPFWRKPWRGIRSLPIRPTPLRPAGSENCGMNLCPSISRSVKCSPMLRAMRSGKRSTPVWKNWSGTARRPMRRSNTLMFRFGSSMT